MPVEGVLAPSPSPGPTPAPTAALTPMVQVPSRPVSAARAPLAPIPSAPEVIPEPSTAIRALQSWPFTIPDNLDRAIIRIRLTDLLLALEYATFANRTPVILDRSGKVDVFFAHRHCATVECKALVLNTSMRHTMSPTDAAHHVVDHVRGAMRLGAYAHLRLADAAPNFASWANASAKTTPVWDRLDVANLFVPKELCSERVVRAWDPVMHGAGAPGVEPLVVRDGFQLVATSLFEPEDAVEFLERSVPLESCVLFHVQDPNG
ncbi:hypothetical protein GGF31_003662 [Allomyces arbusculus]|nr:hypothetical protein GGF31_003662 [Allomyces arbusculus]